MVVVHFKSKNKISILCNSCFSDISDDIKVRCLDCCIDECLDCFIISTYKDIHSGHLFKAVDLLVIDSCANWKILDEYIFFDCLKRFGFGNFEEISYFLGKNENEVEDHFGRLFGINLETQKENKNLPVISNPNFHKVWPYMPKREDFDNQLKDDFEKIIRDIKLEFSDVDYDIKKQMLENYKTIKLLRKKRDSFILERKLFNMPELVNKENRFDNAKRKILKLLKPFSQFVSKNDFNTFLDGLYLEKKLEEILTIKKSMFSKKEEDFIRNMNIKQNVYKKIKSFIVKSKIKNLKLNINHFERKFSLDHTQYRMVVDFFGSEYFDLS